MIRIAFRFDDPSPVSKQMVERKVLNEFRMRGLPITFAVIPASIRDEQEIYFSQETASHLLEGLNAGLVEIALHGLRHTGIDQESCQVPSEFRSVSFQKQAEMIHQGKKELQQVFGEVVSGFVPPWNTYDANTLSAARVNGLSYVSADRSKPPSDAILVLPATCSISRLKNAVEEARRLRHLSPIIVVVLHHYDFDADDDDPVKPQWSYESLGNLLDWLRDKEDLKVETLTTLASAFVSKGVCWPSYSKLPLTLSWRLSRWFPRECVTTKRLSLRNLAVWLTASTVAP